jgi:hypothetical protein
MIRPCILVAAALAACERADPPAPQRPINICVVPPAGTRWSDAAIVDAFVGTGGTDDDRQEIGGLVRDVVLPSVRSSRDLRLFVRTCNEEFGFGERTRARALIVLADTAAWHLRDAAMTLAEARARIEIWPDEPPRRGAPLTIDAIEARAGEIQGLLDELRRRTERYAPIMFADVVVPLDSDAAAVNLQVRMLRDNLRIASGGGYDRANWGLDSRLREHGVHSMPTPDPFTLP